MTTYVDMGGLMFWYSTANNIGWSKDRLFYTRYTGSVLVNEGYNSVRKAAYPDYKAGRKKTSDYAIRAFKLWKDTQHDASFQVVSREGYEADDILAWYGIRGYPVVTRDKDMLQCIAPSLVTDYQGKPTLFNTSKLPVTYRDIAITQEHIHYLLVLLGDKGDNIPPLIKGYTAIREMQVGVEECNWQLMKEYVDYNALLRNLALVTLPHYTLLDISVEEMLNHLCEKTFDEYRLSVVKEKDII